MQILTFDIEEWFLSKEPEPVPSSQWTSFDSRIEKNTALILDLLEKHQQPATFFILGWVAENYPGLVKQIHNLGHEIAYHSWDHQSVSSLMANNSFEEDLKRGLGLLEDSTGKKVRSFRAPYFSFSDEPGRYVDILLKNGIVVDSSVKAFGGKHEFFSINKPFYFECNGDQLLELPLNRLDWPLIKPVFSGSGYFRLLPLKFSRYFFNQCSYTMAYFHPRDFDTTIPVSKRLSLSRNILNRVGVKHTSQKLGAILEGHKFLTVNEAFNLLSKNRSVLPVFKL